MSEGNLRTLKQQGPVFLPLMPHPTHNSPHLYAKSPIWCGGDLSPMSVTLLHGLPG